MGLSGICLACLLRCCGGFTKEDYPIDALKTGMPEQIGKNIHAFCVVSAYFSAVSENKKLGHISMTKAP